MTIAAALMNVSRMNAREIRVETADWDVALPIAKGGRQIAPGLTVVLRGQLEPCVPRELLAGMREAANDYLRAERANRN